MKKCSTPLNIKKMQVKATKRYPLILVWMVIIKQTRIYENVEKGLYTDDSNVNWRNYYGKQYGVSSKN